MLNLIAFTGPPGSGKDVCCTALDQLNWFRIAFADPVRNGVYALNPFIPWGDGFVRLQWIVDNYGWGEAKKIPEVRQLLQRYGTEAGRDIHGTECWVNLAEDKIENLPRNSRVAISDLRFDSELELVRRRHGLLAYVERPGYGPINDHSSEKQYAKFRALADVIIHNDSNFANILQQVTAISGA